MRPDLADIIDGIDPSSEDPVSLLTMITIRSESQDQGPAFGADATLLDHLQGEMQLGGRTYFLLAGRWYEVDGTYIDLVTRDFSRLIEDVDLEAAEIGLRPWRLTETEGSYNATAATRGLAIVGDRILTDNVELFDILISHEGRTYIVHVKRGFDVKVRDVRSQIINSASIIENELRLDDRSRLRRHFESAATRPNGPY
jgi:uncharacterized protein (TIGR04141 family)